ncbi:QRFP-like peptide receptor [Patella vulgata]|uniref:QRFP-like peptide receptor n=1 Tax=Patella vulgata TaxID=6465 RepID=UPI0024A82306|nr:QRFP-like peptide receptor [Patella vulgata]
MNFPAFPTTCVPGDPVSKVSLHPDFTKNVNAPVIPEPTSTLAIFFKVFFYLVAFVLDIVGNSLVLLIIYLNKKMRTTTNVLILNLAVSDLMVGVFCMWVHVGNQMTSEWIFGDIVCKVNTFIQVLALTSSVLTLTVISVERFMAIVFPFKAKWSPWVTGGIVIVDWLAAIAVAAPHLAVRHQHEQIWKDRHEVWCEEVWDKYYKDEKCTSYEPGKIIYYVIEATVMYFLPILIMIVAYTVISVKLLIRKAPGAVISATASAQERAKRKVIKMLVAVLVVFIVCWTPQQVILLWDLFRAKPPDYVQPLKYMALYIAYFNSAMNPILYGGFNENFRKGFSEAFRCLLIRRKNVIKPIGNNTTHRGPTGFSENDVPLTVTNGRTGTKPTTVNTLYTPDA